MAGFLQHVAINTTRFEESVRFFEYLFEMEATRMMGDAPNRKIWFRQGIQCRCQIFSASLDACQ